MKLTGCGQGCKLSVVYFQGFLPSILIIMIRQRHTFPFFLKKTISVTQSAEDMIPPSGKEAGHTVTVKYDSD